MNYFPIVFFNEFWLLRDALIPLNETVSEVPLRLDLYRLPTWKFSLYNQMEESFSMQVCSLNHLLLDHKRASLSCVKHALTLLRPKRLGHHCMQLY